MIRPPAAAPQRGRAARYHACMHIVLNGGDRHFDGCLTVADLLVAAGFGERRVAVEVNREVVPRSRHPTHLLAEGDVVEIIHAIGGG